MTELKQFRLPDVGEGLTEADIVRWHVQAGDRVTINQVIVEIETAKAVVELPCPYEGVVAGLLAAEGQTVDVGVPIISVDVSGTDAGPDVPLAPAPQRHPGGPAPQGPPRGSRPREMDLVPDLPTEEPDTERGRSGGSWGARSVVPPGDAPSGGSWGVVPPGEQGDGGPAKAPERQAVLVGYGVKLGPTTRRARKAPAAAAAPARPARPASAGSGSPGSGSPGSGSPGSGTAPAGNGAAGPQDGTRPVALAKPPVRKLAKDLGIDLAELAGSGPDGSITRDDVQAAAQAPSRFRSGSSEESYPAGPRTAVPSAAVSFVPATGVTGSAREERIGIRGVRKHTAAATVTSAFTAPHVTEFLQVDVTATMEAVRRVRELPEFEGLRVSPMLFVARALIVAAGRNPMINSSWDEDAQEIVVKHYVNLGIAAATRRGLVVPNVKDAQALPLSSLARALADLAATAREGKTRPADLRDGTITITNVGVFGVDTGTPILTPGEAAILALGQVRKAPWVHEGQLAVREVTTLALSFDHRIVDGDLGSAVLRDVSAMLEDPLRMLAWA